MPRLGNGTYFENNIMNATNEAITIIAYTQLFELLETEVNANVFLIFLLESMGYSQSDIVHEFYDSEKYKGFSYEHKIKTTKAWIDFILYEAMIKIRKALKLKKYSILRQYLKDKNISIVQLHERKRYFNNMII